MKSRFGSKFFNWVIQFSEEYDLFNKKESIVAVSGGVDSLALLKVLGEAYQKGMLHCRPVVLHINHQTRSEREHRHDLEMIEKLSKEYGLELELRKLYRGLWGSSNLEHVLRNERSKVFQELAHKYNANVFTAHHLDDSFEWSLMQSFRSSRPERSLGIPLKNKYLRRPFLCVSKAHILKFSNAEHLIFAEDSSNKEERFDRNYLRQKAIPAIQDRYPQYLKHYAFQKNTLAKQLGVHLKGVETKVKLLRYESERGVLLIFPKNSNPVTYEREVREIIESLSSKKRGSLALQIQKLFIALKNNKKGPLSFSGGVHGHLLKNAVYFSKSKKTPTKSDMQKQFPLF